MSVDRDRFADDDAETLHFADESEYMPTEDELEETYEVIPDGVTLADGTSYDVIVQREPGSVAHNANARTGVALGELRDV